jgi:thymidine phosphorylase
MTNYILDLPCGPDTKVTEMDDVKIIKKKFEELSHKFGIKITVRPRKALGPDGRGIGPKLEAIDILHVLKQSPERFAPLEEIALVLAGELLELAGEAKEGKGYDSAKRELVSGKAYEKFKKIVKAQRGNPDIDVIDIKLGDTIHEIKATHGGKVKDIDNGVIKQVCRALGTPLVKEAGMFLHKQVGESFEKGDTLITLYTTSDSRLDLALKILEIKEILIY